jgi:uncharacterized protein YecE (DUF72 family)
LHGDAELYRSGYTPDALERWAQRIALWSSGREPGDAVRASTRRAPRRKSRDVYAYFDNDIKVHAPFDAMALARLLDADRGTELHGEPLPARTVRDPLRRENRSNPWKLDKLAKRPRRSA